MIFHVYVISGLLFGFELDDVYHSATICLFVLKIVICYKTNKWNRYYDDTR